MPKHSALMITAVRTSVRSFSAQWLHLLLNISGLVVGMAAALLILMFVRYELSFDQQHPADENSYRLEQWFVPIAQRFPISSPAMKQLLVQYHPDITVSRFHTSSLKVTPAGQLSPRQMSLQAPMAVEANFTDFFRIDTLQGDLAQVLQQPGLIALSQSEANRLFGAQNALGQLLQLADSSLKVAAIYADLPENTHLVAGSLRRIADSELATSLAINNVYSYVQLPVSVVIADLEQYLTKALKEQGYEGQDIATIQLRAFHDIHLHSALAHELKPNGSIRSVQLAFALACLILLIVAINFINISTARAGSRAREVGVRKTLGASRLQLISQFLLESVLICALAGALAIIVAVLCLPYFNLLVGRQIGLDWAQLAGLQSMLVLLMGLAAGMYPAFYLSAFDAKRVLSGDFQRGGTAIWLRKALLVLQGMISIALIIATLIIQQQLQLLHNAPTGYDRSNTLMAEAIPQAQILQQDNALVQRLRQVPGVQAVSQIDAKLTDTVPQAISMRLPGRTEPTPMIRQIGTGYQISQAAGFQLLAGRDFSADFASDWFHSTAEKNTASMIVSASLVEQLGYPSVSSVIGQVWQHEEHNGKITHLTVVGVMADVQIGSAVNAAAPLVLICGYSVMEQSHLLLHLTADAATGAKEMIREQLRLDDIRFQWVGDEYSMVYQSQMRQGQVVMTFAVLALMLTCIGMLGLSAFTAGQRRREVAIRKILGADRLGLVQLLTLEYLKLMLISALVALPLTYFALQHWLSGFSVRVQQSAGDYLIALLLTLALSWCTVAVIAWRTSARSPAQVLRQAL